eukprot:Hpha_TRINITY_DN15186_c1_g1::TRINITY_DN15186_c1_g1_i2::g.128647::m.128647
MGKGGRGQMAAHLRRVQRLQERVGVPGGPAPEPEVDTSKMTKYEKGRYQVAKTMAQVRQDIQALDELEQGGKASPTRKAELGNRVRKGITAMKKDVSALKRDAEKEGKLRPSPDGGPSDYDELTKHMRRTEELHKQRFKARTFDDDDEDSGDGGGGYRMKTVQDLKDASPGGLGENLIDPREDEEFQMFYKETQQRDQEIDQALEQVYHGVQRLKQHALGIQDTVKEQNQLLDQMDDKTQKRLTEMRSLNKKMKETLKEVEKDKFCCYFICLLVVIGILGVIATQSGMI